MVTDRNSFLTAMNTKEILKITKDTGKVSYSLPRIKQFTTETLKTT